MTEVGAIESGDCVEVVVTKTVDPPPVEGITVVTVDDPGVDEVAAAADEVDDEVELVEKEVVEENSEDVDEDEELVVSEVELVDEVESEDVLTEEEGLVLALELVGTVELDAEDGAAEDGVVVGRSEVVLVEFPADIVNCLNTRIPRCLYAAMSVMKKLMMNENKVAQNDILPQGLFPTPMTPTGGRRKRECFVREERASQALVRFDDRVA